MTRRTRLTSVWLLLAMTAAGGKAFAQTGRATFTVEEATISDIQRALRQKRVTTVGLVELYLRRIKAYNGTCVNEPQGILGPITTIPHARPDQRALDPEPAAGGAHDMGLR